MLTNFGLKDQVDSTKKVAGSGFVLLLICLLLVCLVTYALIELNFSKSWLLLGVSLFGAVVGIDELRLYVKGKRGLRK